MRILALIFAAVVASPAFGGSFSINAAAAHIPASGGCDRIAEEPGNHPKTVVRCEPGEEFFLHPVYPTDGPIGGAATLTCDLYFKYPTAIAGPSNTQWGMTAAVAEPTDIYDTVIFSGGLFAVYPVLVAETIGDMVTVQRVHTVFNSTGSVCTSACNGAPMVISISRVAAAPENPNDVDFVALNCTY